MRNLDLKYRTIEDKSLKRGLLCVVGRGKEPILIGDNMMIRDGSSFRNAKAREVIEAGKRMKQSQGRHLWIKSLRKFCLFFKEKN